MISIALRHTPILGNLQGYFHHNLKENCIMVFGTKHMKQMPHEGIPEKSYEHLLEREIHRI